MRAKILSVIALLAGLILSHDSEAALEIPVDCAAAAGDIYITESQLEANQCALDFKPNASCGQFIWSAGTGVSDGDIVVKFNNVDINKDTATPIMGGTVAWAYSGSASAAAGISFKTAEGSVTNGGGDVNFFISMPSSVCATTSSDSSTSAPATPIPTLPLFGLFALAGLLGLFGLRKV